MFLYRCLISLAAPLVLIRLLWRLARGRETLRGVAERLGGGVSLRGHKVLWLHGASNGELASARAVVDTLLARDPALHVLITTNTETGRTLALGWGLARTHVQIAPLDHRLVLARFLGRTRPRAALMLENELWPNRFAALARRGDPGADRRRAAIGPHGAGLGPAGRLHAGRDGRGALGLGAG